MVQQTSVQFGYNNSVGVFVHRVNPIWESREEIIIQRRIKMCSRRQNVDSLRFHQLARGAVFTFVFAVNGAGISSQCADHITREYGSRTNVTADEWIGEDIPCTSCDFFFTDIS